MKTISVVLNKRQSVEWEYEFEGQTFLAKISLSSKDSWQVIDNIRNGKYLLSHTLLHLVMFDRVLQKEVGLSSPPFADFNQLKAAKAAWVSVIHNTVMGAVPIAVTVNSKQVEVVLATSRSDWKAIVRETELAQA